MAEMERDWEERRRDKGGGESFPAFFDYLCSFDEFSTSLGRPWSVLITFTRLSHI